MKGNPISTATIASKGRTTIPKAVREGLRLKAGDRVEFVIQEDGSVLMIPATVRVADLEGILPAPEKALSVEEMNRMIQARGGRS